MKLIGQKNPPWWSALDPELKPIIKDLWEMGYTTRGSSCAGHPDRSGVRMLGNIMFNRAYDREDIKTIRTILESHGLINIKFKTKLAIYPDIRLTRVQFNPVGKSGPVSQRLRK